MAEPDGSLVFVTALDAEGFEKGTEKLLKAIENLKASVDNMGANMQQSFNRAGGSVRAVANAASKGANEAAAAAARYDAELEKQQAKIDAQYAKLRDYFSAIDANNKNLEDQLAKTTREDQRAILAEMAKNEEISLNVQYAKELAILGQLEAEQERLKEKRDAAARAAQAASAGQQAEEQSERLLTDQLKPIVSAFEAQIQKLPESFKAQLVAMSTAATIEGNVIKEKLYNSISGLEPLVGRLKPTFLELGHAINVGFGELNVGIKSGVISVLETFGNVARSALLGIANLSVRAVDGIGSLLKSVAKLAAQFAKLPFRAFTSSIKSFANQSGKAALNSNALVKSLTSMKRLLITRIKRTFISAIFNQAKESLQTLAKFSGGFNTAMSNIKNASTQTAGNLAVSIGGVIKTLEPMITGFINALNTAIVAVNKFFAMLGGKSTMTVAKKQTDDYAASLDKAGGSAKKASKQLYSFDEIERQQAEDAGGGADVDAGNLFEEMEIGENLFNSWGEAFDNMLDTILSDGIPRLREGLLNFADWLNGITGKVYEMFTFPGVLEKVQQIGQDLAIAFNNMVSAINWQQLGQALGAGLNLALQFLINFIYTFDWLALGAGFAEAFNGMVSEIDWYAVGGLLWAKFKIALETLAGFLTGLNMPQLAEAASNIVMGFFDSMTKTVESIPWAQVGQKISEALTNIKWKEIGASVANSFNAIVRALKDVVKTIKWSQIALDFTTGLNKFIKTIDWATAGQTFSDSFHGVLEFLKTAAANFDWAGLGADIAEFIVNIDWGQLFLDLLEVGVYVIGGLLEGILSVIGGIEKWVKDNIIKPFIEAITGKQGFDTHSPSKVTEEIGGNVGQGILDGILGIFGNIKDWIKENITDPFINNVKSFFGISGDSSSIFSEIGTNLANGLKKGITDAWDSVVTKAKGLADKVTSTVQNAFQVHSPSRVFAEIGEYLDAGLAEGIKDEENTVLKTVRNLAAAATGEMKNGNLGISAAGTNVVLDGFATKISDSVNALVETLQAIADNVTFRVPNIAAGTVVPAGVAAAVENASGYGAAPAAYGGGADYSGILNRMLQIMQSGQVLVVNGTTFARLVYEANQSEANRYGASLVQVMGRGY